MSTQKLPETISQEAIQAASAAIRDALHKNYALWDIARMALEAAALAETHAEEQA